MTEAKYSPLIARQYDKSTPESLSIREQKNGWGFKVEFSRDGDRWIPWRVLYWIGNNEVNYATFEGEPSESVKEIVKEVIKNARYPSGVRVRGCSPEQWKHGILNDPMGGKENPLPL